MVDAKLSLKRSRLIQVLLVFKIISNNTKLDIVRAWLNRDFFFRLNVFNNKHMS